MGRENRALTDVLEPGSVIKVLTVAAALETGRYTPDTVTYVAKAGFQHACTTAHDLADAHRALGNSSMLELPRLPVGDWSSPDFVRYMRGRG